MKCENCKHLKLVTDKEVPYIDHCFCTKYSVYLKWCLSESFERYILKYEKCQIKTSVV